MAEPVRSVAEPAKPSSVTEVIADGLAVVLANPLLMLLPALVDVYYWVGWRVTSAPAFDTLRSPLLASDDQQVRELAGTLDDWTNRDLTAIAGLFVPTLLGGADRSNLYQPWERPDLTISQLGAVVVVVVLMVGVASLLFGIFGTMIADASLSRRRQAGEGARAAMHASGRFLGLLAAMLTVFAVLIGPLIAVWAVLAVVGVDLRAVFLPIATLLVIALVVLLYFAPEAIVVNEAGPIAAMQMSANVVRRNTWATIGLAASSLIITTGLGEVWRRLAGNAPGFLIAIIANALVGSGLASAGVLFFKQRWDVVVASADHPAGSR